MNKNLLKFAVLFLIAASVVSPSASAADFPVGSKLDSFSLTGIDGKDHSFNSLMGKNGAVIVFLSAQCPVVKAYNERINQVAADYAAKGINFIGINSNSTEDLAWISSDAAQVGYKFPVLIDKGNVLADKLGATVTPEVYFFDTKNVLLYHGAIDNDRSAKNIQEQYLRTAFDTALSGGKIEKTKTAAFGCTIKRASGSE